MFRRYHSYNPNLSYQIIQRRIEDSEDFACARDTVLSQCEALCQGKDAAGIKELGGYSALLTRAISELPAEFDQDFGSALIPMSVKDALRSHLPLLREELQHKVVEAQHRPPYSMRRMGA